MSRVPAGDARPRILEAVFALVRRDGVAAVSQRRVGAESGINVGSVRHHFPTRESMMIAAADEVGRRMERRLAGCPQPVPGDRDAAVAALEAVCRALIPIGDRGRDELVVLQEFLVAARLSETYRPLAGRMGADLRSVLRAALTPLVADDAALDVEVELLVAVIAGLSAELVQPHGMAPGTDPAEVVGVHLRRLAG
ncbi:transcriptional regulator, TetR family [Pseudonocardia ammonioxydans]|uniref:Transcriptional regulator, TetR family n=1 Tax=Pseudonocardia ammonioxydans TaxID=260086 RepID=A0A1I5ASC8_PSUAM|nr:TetR/AcrR family transcriptional regulator [Pseudonocardia ammonioxydans]SFN65300.1 transcriptional regulator, TetR family [Pseudonocardia ammonioxydans]